MWLSGGFAVVLAARSGCYDCDLPAPCGPSVAWLIVIFLCLMLIRAHFLLKAKEKEKAPPPPPPPPLPAIRAPIDGIFDKHKKEAENWSQAQAKAALERAQADVGKELTKHGFPAPPPPAPAPAKS